MSGRKVLLVLVIGLGLAAAAGCQQGVAREDFDNLKTHNQKLMEENAQLKTEWEQMKADQSMAKSTPPPTTYVEPPTAAVAPVTPTNNDINKLAGKLPPNTQLVERDGKAVIRIDGSLVNFGSGKASLTPDGKSAMDKVAVILNRDFPTRTVIVEGHTDSDPINRTRNLYKSNWELGMKRSTEVVDYLTLKGVDPKRIRAMSFGEHQPISQDKAKNRRVEIVVMPEDAFVAPTPTAALPY